ncbi:hypothetical protein Tco_0155867 [Tanacetum coccineum]
MIKLTQKSVKLELLSDYDCELRYHPGKANVVADALSRKNRPKLLRVRALVVTIGLNLPTRILNAQYLKEVGFMSDMECLFRSSLVVRMVGRSVPILAISQEVLEILLQTNSYHTSIKAAPFEALYGRKMPRYLLVGMTVGDTQLTGPESVLNPRYIGAFKILAKVGTVAYRLELPEKLSRVHSTFHVSNLKKCLSDEPLAIPLDKIHIDEKLHFIEEPVEIMDREVKHLKQSRIPIVKISKKVRILELKRRHLKINVLTSNTSYPSRKIRRICACTSLKTTKEQDPIRRLTSIKVNGKNAYELKRKFLDDLHNNAFSGTNGEDAVEHIEYFLRIVDPIDLPNVNQDKLRVLVFPILLVGNAWKWFDEI